MSPLKQWTAVASSLIIATIMVQTVLASPPGSKYTPGETLDPTCTPGSSNCTVTTPLLSSNNLSDLASASTARSNLGLVIGTNVQAFHAALASIAGLTTAANKMLYTTASDTYATTDLTSIARTLLSKTTTGAMTTYLRAVTPSYSGDVSISGSVTANQFIGDGSQLTNVLSDGSVTSSHIADGTIANSDINSSANISFSKLNIAKSDITGLGIPGADTTYSAGSGLTLNGTTFAVDSSIVRSNYSSSLLLAGTLTAQSAALSRSISSVANTMTNTSNNSNAGVLRLSLSGITSPSSTNHYIEFYDASSLLGSIRGNGAGAVEMAWISNNPAAWNSRPGLQFVSAGADYAEYLERADHNERIAVADIVGVREGKISRVTKGADSAMVVSASPVVIGNQPAGNIADYTAVAFVGQVAVRVLGPVISGQYIVASGKNDGIGIAKAKNNLTPDDLLVGQAWETVKNNGETFVKIGIVPGPVIVAHGPTQSSLQQQIDDLRTQLTELRSLFHAR